MFSEVEKLLVKNNRDCFYREGSFILNSILEKNGDKISFSELKKIFRSNRLLRDLYSNISNVGNSRKMYWDFYDFSDRYIININGMINYKSSNNFNIVKENNRLYIVKEDFIIMKKNGYKMIKDSLDIFRFVRSEDVK